MENNNQLENVNNSVNSFPENGVTEHQKMFAAPFSTQGRIRRKEYIISFLGVSVGSGIVEGLLQSLGNFFIVNLAVVVIFLAFLFIQGIKRCHDRNNPGWWIIIPFYGLFLLFAAGDKGSNQYGPDPKR